MAIYENIQHNVICSGTSSTIGVVPSHTFTVTSAGATASGSLCVQGSASTWAISDSGVSASWDHPLELQLAELPPDMPAVLLTPRTKAELEALRTLVYDAQKEDPFSDKTSEWEEALDQMNLWVKEHGFEGS